MFTASVTSENKCRKIFKNNIIPSFYNIINNKLGALIFLLSPLELIHRAVEAKSSTEPHEGGLCHHRLESDQEEAPPGKEDDLPVGQHTRYH